MGESIDYYEWALCIIHSLSTFALIAISPQANKCTQIEGNSPRSLCPLGLTCLYHVRVCVYAYISKKLEDRLRDPALRGPATYPSTSFDISVCVCMTTRAGKVARRGKGG